MAIHIEEPQRWDDTRSHKTKGQDIMMEVAFGVAGRKPKEKY
jgi:hypothetical protein